MAHFFRILCLVAPLLLTDLGNALVASAAEPSTAASIASQDHRLKRYLVGAREHYSMMVSSSGLLFRVHGGFGPRPRANDTVIVNIAAKGPDGTTDLRQISAASVRTRVADLLPGLAEGVQMIALGGEGFFILPPHLSFGTGEWPPGLEPGMPLAYRITLSDIIPQPTP